MKMNARLIMQSIAAALVMSLTAGNAALAGPIGVVDDHTVNDSLSAYTLSRVNDPNTTANVSFSEAAGNLRVSYSGTPVAVEQVLLLRDDYTLGVGQTLMADVTLPPTGGWDRDLGIAVGISETPSANGPGQSGDKRTNFVQVAWRSNNQVVSIGRNGAAFFASGQEFAGTSYNLQPAFNVNDPLSLYISHVTANKFEVGWIQNKVKHPLTANGTALNYTFSSTPVPEAAVGYYADVRTVLASSPVGLDNLRIVPEPTSLALLGLSTLGLLARRRS